MQFTKDTYGRDWVHSTHFLLFSIFFPSFPNSWLQQLTSPFFYSFLLHKKLAWRGHTQDKKLHAGLVWRRGQLDGSREDFSFFFLSSRHWGSWMDPVKTQEKKLGWIPGTLVFSFFLLFFSRGSHLGVTVSWFSFFRYFTYFNIIIRNQPDFF